jgi:DNA polymerase I-like protein with 3'-5' exonuclease and polymerase domains
VAKKKQEHSGQMGLFRPEMDPWERPEFLPNWLSCPTIALDLETKDDGLNNEKGGGWAFKDHGFISGISISNGDKSFYFPMRHPDTDNFPVEQVHRWIKAHLTRPNGKTIFHNSHYDVGWIWREIGFFPLGEVGDTMFKAYMLDENRFSYKLDSIAKLHGYAGKDKARLTQAAAAMGLHPMKEMWRMPARYVGPYAETDAHLTFQIDKDMEPQIVEQDLQKAYKLECDLVECCVRMRMRGIRINEEKVPGRIQFFREKRDAILHELTKEMAIGRQITMEDLMSPKRLSQFFDHYNLTYPLTKKNNMPSFQSKWMATQEHWLPQSIEKARKFDMAAEKFLGTFVLKYLVDGRIHAEIHQTRDEEGGTRSYRFSYSNPPLQQSPTRGEDIAGLIREAFLPEEEEEWCVEDYSQQEPRFTVHYAAALGCEGWQKAVDYYTNTPDADYHTMVSEMTGIERKRAKVINLGLTYGMQLKHLSDDLGVSVEDGKKIMNNYHSELPYVNALSKTCEQKTAIFGFIKLIDGARCRFDLWRPKDQWFGPAYPYEKAKKEWPNEQLGRADLRVAMNRLIQGSAARQTKKAMLDGYRAGYLPLIQMHDDLNFSLSDRRDAIRIRQIMIDAIPIRVPVKVDIEIGPSWGEAEEWNPA